MRIFINTLIKNNDKINELFNCYQSNEQYVEIYSLEGIYKITSQNLFQLKYNDIPLETVDNFLGSKLKVNIDRSVITYEVVHQIPSNHLNVLIKKNYFVFNENSPIKYVIEETYDVTDYLNITPLNINDINNIDINTCYIELPENINLQETKNKKEIYKLLSLFN